MMKVFSVFRKSDETGVSGTGHVINGVIFDDGTVVIRWRTKMSSIAIYNSFKEFKAIHIDSHPLNESIIKMFEIPEGHTNLLEKAEIMWKRYEDEIERLKGIPIDKLTEEEHKLLDNYMMDKAVEEANKYWLRTLFMGRGLDIQLEDEPEHV